MDLKYFEMLIYVVLLIRFADIDQVALGSGLVIPRQSIGVKTGGDFGTNDVDGILGVGPQARDSNTVSTIATSFATVVDNLVAQGDIQKNLIAISFQPSTVATVKNGEMCFGDMDPKKFIGGMTWIPLTNQAPATSFWGIEQSLTYGGQTLLPPASAGIVDTGTTLLLLETSAFKQYQQLTGALFDAYVVCLHMIVV